MMSFLLGLLVGLILLIVALVWRTRSLQSFRNYLFDSMSAFGSGRYDVRMYPYRNRRMDTGVFRQFNQMAEYIEQQFEEMSQERDILRHILESMTTGVVYLRNDGQVQMVNQAVERLFRRPAEQWQDRDHWTVFRNYNLGAAIDHALLFGTPWTDELTIREGLTVSIRLEPLSANPRVNSRSEGAYDVLMLVNDVSEWRRLERMRSEFVANVSHELKTPIAAIRGFAETLLDEDGVDQELNAKFLKTIFDESLRMGNLVSDLLELSKLEAMDSRIEPTSIDLMSIVERAMDRLKPAADKRGIRILTTEAARVTVWAEPDMLLQVFLNLLGNAIHYSSDDSEVTVSWDVLIDRVKVHVRDKGIGIPKDSLDRVFERFYRVHKDRSRASGGTGLGLAIVKHVVTSLGGEVGVESVEGQGSDFWFTLSRLDTTLPTALRP